jgi:hypothetical protein
MSRLVVFVTLLLVWGTTGALACSCIQPTVEEAVHRADAVFLGTVTRGDTSDLSLRIIIQMPFPLGALRNRSLPVPYPIPGSSAISRRLTSCSRSWTI